MEPMNAFLSAHRDSFKAFIDDMCTLPASGDHAKPTSSSSSHKPTSYSTPLAIKKRLPLTSREGFPSLPYLIDQAREFAGLIELWLHGTAGKDGTESIAMAIGSDDGALLSFHTLCSQLSARTQDCLSRAERAERPSSSLSFRWDQLIDQLQHSAALGLSRPGSSVEVPGKELMSSPAAQTFDQETPTRNSFDNVVAIHAAGEAAARSRGARAVPDTLVDLDQALEDENYDRSPDDFENDRDGGAASVEASMLQHGISTMSLDRRAGIHFRSSFDMHGVRPSFGSALGGGSNSLISTTISRGPGGQLQTSHTISNFSPREPLTRDVDTRRMIGSAGLMRGSSAHGSQMSGFSNTSESESNMMTATPIVQQQQQQQHKEREREKLKKKEKEENGAAARRPLVDSFSLPLANMVGGLRGRRREKKEREAIAGE